MDENWSKLLLKYSKRETESDETEFLRLVDLAAGSCNLDTVRVLMKTFSAKPDYGTQERVISVLATANVEDVTTGLLEELPRLLEEAPDWAEALVGTEVEHRPQLLSAIASTMSIEIKRALQRVIGREEFRDFYPNSKLIRV